MKLEAILVLLEELADDGLHSIETRCQELQAQHDRERKDKALEQARTLLASVGLSLKDVAGKAHKGNGKSIYHAGTQYQHPINKALTYNGKGKKPGWLTALESEGKSAVEVASV